MAKLSKSYAVSLSSSLTEQKLPAQPAAPGPVLDRVVAIHQWFGRQAQPQKRAEPRLARKPPKHD
jgi:hypothetical protein